MKQLFMDMHRPNWDEVEHADLIHELLKVCYRREEGNEVPCKRSGASERRRRQLLTFSRGKTRLLLEMGVWFTVQGRPTHAT